MARNTTLPSRHSFFQATVLPLDFLSYLSMDGLVLIFTWHKKAVTPIFDVHVLKVMV